MDQHLNLFRFFHESRDPQFIENNLSRAFAICLKNSKVLFNDYIRQLVSETDYKYLFESHSSEANCLIDLQIEVGNIDRESYRKVYAVALTGDRGLDMSDFHAHSNHGKVKKEITDIFISIKDIAFIIEVKRYGTNCKVQLYNQIYPFIIEKRTIEIIPKSCSWHEVIKLMEKTRNIHHLLHSQNYFINDFLTLSEIRFPDWFEPKPFHILPFSEHVGSTEHVQLMKRMRQALSLVDSQYKLLPYDRLGLSVPFGWASELIPKFECGEDKDRYIVFYIWPGNIKRQGYSIYDKSLDWTKKKEFHVKGRKYDLKTEFNIKFSHFAGYVSEINFSIDDIEIPIHTADNFKNKSGKWEEESWQEFEVWMDSHFMKAFDWREECAWEDNFVKTDRTYFTMSLGFEVSARVPYSEFQEIDRKEEDVQAVASKIKEIADAFHHLI